MALYKNDPRLSTKNKASVVANVLGHRVYTNNECALDGPPSTTSRVLANDKTLDETLFCPEGIDG